MDQQVKRVKRELIKHGAILDMYEDTMELPDGKQETWDFISHRKGRRPLCRCAGMERS